MERRLGIVIPVYNEGENIAPTVRAISEQVKTPHSIYIVYDFDEDTTLPAARKLAKEGHPIQLLKNGAPGVVHAIKTGLRQASEPYLLVTMGDSSDDYRVVDDMFLQMEKGFDVVCGSRHAKGGKQIGGPVLKKLIAKTASKSLKLLTGIPTHDVTNSFKCYRKSLLDSMELESRGGFEIGMEITVKAHFNGYKVTEIPCVWTDRTAGKSRFKILKWAPHYLKWYRYALKKRFLG